MPNFKTRWPEKQPEDQYAFDCKYYDGKSVEYDVLSIEEFLRADYLVGFVMIEFIYTTWEIECN